jgi:triphosphoribosyl-dephospho-CoA synthase
MQALLAQTTVEDAENVYEAIRYAVPGGMGEVESEDVSRRPTKKLLEVMSMSADRDNIGYQYANDFAPIIEMGVQKFTETIQTGCPIERAIMQNQMEWLGRYPDSLIARKLGREETRIIRDKAKEFFLEGEFETVEGRKLYRLLDRFLRLGRNKLNPGTTADLVTATLFVWLRTNPIDPAWRFTWTEYDR